MPSSDQPATPSSPHLPTPPSGAGAADLATDSTDPRELHDLLERARERLAFYESFDRIIGENIRRSGELMVETVTLREQAQAISTQAAQERAKFEATREADRDRYRALIQNALDEAASVRPVIDAMMARLQDVLGELGAGSGSNNVVTSTPESTEERPGISTAPVADEAPPSTGTPPVVPELPVHDDEASPDEDATADTVAETTAGVRIESAPEPAPAPSDEATDEAADATEATEDRIIDVLAHGVPSAKIAISLQKMLRGLDVVTNVEAREFADGELRLAVTATGALPADALSIWLTDNQGELTSRADTVTEISFHEG